MLFAIPNPNPNCQSLQAPPQTPASAVHGDMGNEFRKKKGKLKEARKRKREREAGNG